MSYNKYYRTPQGKSSMADTQIQTRPRRRPTCSRLTTDSLRSLPCCKRRTTALSTSSSTFAQNDCDQVPQDHDFVSADELVSADDKLFN